MTSINDITTAVYRLLVADETLAGLCTVYKGPRRPARAENPSLTVTAKRLGPGEGGGMWLCDIVTTAYTDLTAAKTPDTVLPDTILCRVRELLADAEPDIPGAKAFPLIEGESGAPGWDASHDHESGQEQTFGCVFVSF